MSILTWIEDKKRLKVLNAPKYVNSSSDSSKGLWTRCDKCGVILYIKHLKENQRVCFGCSYHLQMMSQERIENLLDKVPVISYPSTTKNKGIHNTVNLNSSTCKSKIYKPKATGSLLSFDSTSAPKVMRDGSPLVCKSPTRVTRTTFGEEIQGADQNPVIASLQIEDLHENSNQPIRENMVSTWRPLDETVSPCDPLKFLDQKNYTDRLQDAQERTGLQDAIQTGTGMIDGIPVALAVMDFSFMGGSMGSVVGEKITRLIEYATQEGLTLIIVSASGGARMQEGVFSLMQMAKISSALQIYQSCAKLLYISILTSPTTGGVTASFAMLGDIIFAEPKALIAFAGRRVIEQTLCEDLPDDFQTSEYMLHHGLVDLIVPRRFLRQALSESIRLYQNAPFKKIGRIPFGVQNPITFLTEEKVRRQWGQLTKQGTKYIELEKSTFKELSLFSSKAAQNIKAGDTCTSPKVLRNRMSNIPSSAQGMRVMPHVQGRNSTPIASQVAQIKGNTFSEQMQESGPNTSNEDFTEIKANSSGFDFIHQPARWIDQSYKVMQDAHGRRIQYRDILTSFRVMLNLFDHPQADASVMNDMDHLHLRRRAFGEQGEVDQSRRLIDNPSSQISDLHVMQGSDKIMQVKTDRQSGEIAKNTSVFGSNKSLTPLLSFQKHKSIIKAFSHKKLSNTSALQNTAKLRFAAEEFRYKKEHVKPLGLKRDYHSGRACIRSLKLKLWSFLLHNNNKNGNISITEIIEKQKTKVKFLRMQIKDLQASSRQERARHYSSKGFDYSCIVSQRLCIAGGDAPTCSVGARQVGANASTLVAKVRFLRLKFEQALNSPILSKEFRAQNYKKVQSDRGLQGYKLNLSLYLRAQAVLSFGALCMNAPTCPYLLPLRGTARHSKPSFTFVKSHKSTIYKNYKNSNFRTESVATFPYLRLHKTSPLRTRACAAWKRLAKRSILLYRSPIASKMRVQVGSLNNLYLSENKRKSVSFAGGDPLAYSTTLVQNRSFVSAKPKLNYARRERGIFGTFNFLGDHKILEQDQNLTSLSRNSQARNGALDPSSTPRIAMQVPLMGQEDLQELRKRENDLNFLNQAIELAATESVEWRAFYIDQQFSENKALNLSLEGSITQRVMHVACKTICRSDKVVGKE